MKLDEDNIFGAAVCKDGLIIFEQTDLNFNRCAETQIYKITDSVFMLTNLPAAQSMCIMFNLIAMVKEEQSVWKIAIGICEKLSQNLASSEMIIAGYSNGGYHAYTITKNRQSQRPEVNEIQAEMFGDYEKECLMKFDDFVYEEATTDEATKFLKDILSQSVMKANVTTSLTILKKNKVQKLEFTSSALPTIDTARNDNSSSSDAKKIYAQASKYYEKLFQDPIDEMARIQMEFDDRAHYNPIAKPTRARSLTSKTNFAKTEISNFYNKAKRTSTASSTTTSAKVLNYMYGTRTSPVKANYVITNEDCDLERAIKESLKDQQAIDNFVEFKDKKEQQFIVEEINEDEDGASYGDSSLGSSDYDLLNDEDVEIFECQKEKRRLKKEALKVKEEFKNTKFVLSELLVNNPEISLHAISKNKQQQDPLDLSNKVPDVITKQQDYLSDALNEARSAVEFQRPTASTGAIPKTPKASAVLKSDETSKRRANSLLRNSPNKHNRL